MTELEKQVLEMIPTGAGQPRAGRYIATALRLDIRTVRNIINQLIIKYNVPIVAKRGVVSGYYIPENDTERIEGIREFKAQHDSEAKRLNVLISADLVSYKQLLKGTNANV